MSRAGLYRATIAIATATVIAACGSSTTHSSSAGAPPTGSTTTSTPAGHGLTIRPSAVGPRTTVTFGFVPSRAAGRQGQVVISYGLLVSGPTRAGCIGARSSQASHAVRDQLTELVLAPTGTRWCTGPYLARVQEIARPYCKPGLMCPQYVRVIATVATARFTVAAS